MAEQLRKRFSTEEVKMLLQKYLDEKVKSVYILKTLGVKRGRFFELLKEYKKVSASFSIQYKRKSTNRKISEEVEKNQSCLHYHLLQRSCLMSIKAW